MYNFKIIRFWYILKGEINSINRVNTDFLFVLDHHVFKLNELQLNKMPTTNTIFISVCIIVGGVWVTLSGALELVTASSLVINWSQSYLGNQLELRVEPGPPAYQAICSLLISQFYFIYFGTFVLYLSGVHFFHIFSNKSWIFHWRKFVPHSEVLKII